MNTIEKTTNNSVNKRIFYPIFCLGVCLASCNKQLDKLPDNRTVISHVDQVTQLLTSAYPHAVYMAFTEPLSDNAEDKGTAPASADPESYQINSQSYRYEDVTSVKYDSPIAYWDSCYRAIAVANQALTYCNGPDSANFAAQKGEALVCRAYAHFMLVCLFAKPYDPSTAAADPGIPYVTKPQGTVFEKYQRGTVQSVYDNIESDLTRGLSLIQDKTYGTAPKFHFTLQAAHAFASRFYLFKQDLARVITHASAVFGTANPASLIRNPVVDYATLQYQQLAIKYVSSSENANILLQEAQSSYFDNYAQYRYGYGQGLNANFFNGPNVTGGEIGIITYGATPQVFNFPKWSPYSTGNGRYGLFPLFSMEEVLMNRAEAYARTNNTTAALADLNTWVSRNINNYNPSSHNVTATKARNFYGTSNTSLALVLAALDFKRFTYMQEGLRWFDVIRLGISVVRYAGSDFSTVVEVIRYDDKRRVLQLPPEAVNAGLELNPR
ncbi:RagB/SusD family nutrient uptake outer membrane protein [Flavitalea sp. BT771]|uniref:RagB/SusD family nutrient uptake outer membrane protein n=1 Tax=Flavitalea sp. BT771 TaxID=3063329 RepID=UPI0026E413D2|nr:RagB/SusD family nutrient uptake outer membrane protein [Flavitalea sp. BT771]MDO6435171.1 RagB/SusD family nutrient uptake outer membrane protein [Flavitalea sp. BT771]MDV6224124.1 RagB/SusD family nutrient uptake outer membrane protein [Flavitalea sp. BT771]